MAGQSPTMAVMENIERIEPQAGGQVEYFTRDEFEVLFGGRAGPGKTWAIVLDALGLQYQATIGKAAYEVPEYRAVIFRRKTTQLIQIIDEAKRYFLGDPFYATFAAGRRGDPGPSFLFPSGAKIFCCHMQHENDKEAHHGIEYQFIGFDELTTFTLTQYLYLFWRARSKTPGLTPRIRSTSNWIGPGLVWVKKRFVKNGSFRLEPNKRYWFLPAEDPVDNPTGIPAEEGTKYARTRAFIPGFLEENKKLVDVEGYISNIKAMGKKYEKALLKGDPDAFGGDFFDEFDQDEHIIQPIEIPEHWKLWGSLDPGWSSPCSFGLNALSPEGIYYRLMTYYVRGRGVTDHAEAISERVKGFEWTDGRLPKFVAAGHDAFYSKDRHAITKSDLTWQDIFKEYDLKLIRAKTDRVPGWWAWKDLISRGIYQVFDNYNNSLIEEMISGQHDEKDVEDLLGRGNDETVPDHALDEQRYGIMAQYKPPKKVVEKLAEGREKWGGIETAEETVPSIFEFDS
jgi:hypothetical protein